MNDDLISRQAAIDELLQMVLSHKGERFNGELLHWTGVKAMLECLPSVQQKTGHWIWKKRRRTHNNTVERTVKSIHGVESKEPVIIHDEWTEDVNYCSACGKRGDDTFFNYCPNCGAKMGGEAE